MILLHETHEVAGRHEDEFEAAYREGWLAVLAETEDARLLHFLHHAHGTGVSYNVVTITLLRDAERKGRQLMETAQMDAVYAPADRLLVEQVYVHGIAPARIAGAAGKTARSINRNIRNLLKTMNSPLFQLLADHGDLQVRTHLATLRCREISSTASPSIFFSCVQAYVLCFVPSQSVSKCGV